MAPDTAHGDDGHARRAAHETATTRSRDAPVVGPVLFMAFLFIVSFGLALTIAPTFSAEEVQAFEDPQSLTNPLIYLVIVVVFTAIILAIAKYGKKWMIRAIILGAVFMTINYVTWPLLAQIVPADPAVLVSLAIAVVLTTLLVKYPEWWVIDTTGVLVSAGAAAIFGISFGLLPALILLVAFAVYDAIAVYRTKHMIDLADSVLELRLPIMFVVPRHRGYSFLKETEKLKEKLDEGEEREAMFMGLGDVVIPAVLAVSALEFLPTAVGVLGFGGPLTVALATLAGALAGFGALMYFVLKGNPQAGLPLLNGGAVVGFFAALLPLYGLAPLSPF